MMLAKMPSAEIRLRKSGGGVFEITVDGKLAYSKKIGERCGRIRESRTPFGNRDY